LAAVQFGNAQAAIETPRASIAGQRSTGSVRIRKKVNGSMLTSQEVIGRADSMAAISSGSSMGPRLLNLLYRPDVGLHEVASAASMDPTVALRIIRIANSPYYGLGGRVFSIDQALQILGMDAVKGIAAASCLDHFWRGNTALGKVDIDRYLRHSLAVAIGARNLEVMLGGAGASEMFLAGLMHDLGYLLHWQLRPDQMRALIAMDAQCADVVNGRRAEVLEVGLIGISHAQSAALAFGVWELPTWLQACVSHHHAPLQAPDEFQRSAAIVYLADALSMRAGLTFLGDHPEPTVLAHILETYEVSPKVCDVVLEELSPAVDQILSDLN
jgi:HD-like signal output (HDOD) protein